MLEYNMYLWEPQSQYKMTSDHMAIVSIDHRKSPYREREISNNSSCFGVQMFDSASARHVTKEAF